jgi:hypothetical protein
MVCIELLSKDARRRARQGEPQSGEVVRHRFQELHWEGRRLVCGWAERAANQFDCPDQDSFEPFIFGWIALNGWACCVTEEDRDSGYLDALLLDSDLDRGFNEHLAGNLLAAARDFHSTWPIFSSKDIGHNLAGSASRKQAIERYTKINPPPLRRPACAFLHRDRGEEIPVDWPHTLSAIYQVRCTCSTAIRAFIRRMMF